MNKLTLMLKRAKTFNRLIEPILEKLPGFEKDRAHYAIVGFMSNHVPIKELKVLQKDLEKEFEDYLK